LQERLQKGDAVVTDELRLELASGRMRGEKALGNRHFGTSQDMVMILLVENLAANGTGARTKTTKS
jgi:hypothetical protein